jgi:hypothetical protein
MSDIREGSYSSYDRPPKKFYTKKGPLPNNCTDLSEEQKNLDITRLILLKGTTENF